MLVPYRKLVILIFDIRSATDTIDNTKLFAVQWILKDADTDIELFRVAQQKIVESTFFQISFKNYITNVFPSKKF